jgi:uncharacterized protein
MSCFKDEIEKLKRMEHIITWFEIPVSDFERAVHFYEEVFQIKMEPANMGAYKMAFFPDKGAGTVSGALCYGDGYIPSGNGNLLYLNANPDMEALLNRVNAAGGRVLALKTLISKEQGYFGLFLDTENNKIAVHSRD